MEILGQHQEKVKFHSNVICGIESTFFNSLMHLGFSNSRHHCSRIWRLLLPRFIVLFTVSEEQMLFELGPVDAIFAVSLIIILCVKINIVNFVGMLLAKFFQGVLLKKFFDDWIWLSLSYSHRLSAKVSRSLPLRGRHLLLGNKSFRIS